MKIKSHLLVYYTMKIRRGRRGRDRMVVIFITTYTISAYHIKVGILNHAHGEMYSIQHYVMTFVSYMRQVGGVHRVFLFPHALECYIYLSRNTWLFAR